MASFFSPSEEESQESQEQGGGSGAKVVSGLLGFVILLPVIALVGIPAAIVGIIFYQLLTRVRLRPHVVFGVATAFSLLAVAFWTLTSADALFLDVFRNLGELSDNWTKMLPALLSVSAVLGAYCGWVTTVLAARQLRDSPHLRSQEGRWSYNFTYRRTPREWLKMRKRKRALSEDDLNDEEKVPLGINVETDEIVFRYYAEANKQTLVTGGVGSGKALAGDTPIPTIDGFVLARDVEEGDALFSDQGVATCVVGKYQPRTEDHYKLAIEGGIEIKACGDHIWPVRLDSDQQLHELTTRELAEKLRDGEARIPRVIQPVEYSDRKKRSGEAWEKAGLELLAGSPLDDDSLISSPTSRERILHAALRREGKGYNGIASLVLPTRAAAASLQSLTRSLALKTTRIHEAWDGFEIAFENPFGRELDLAPGALPRYEEELGDLLHDRVLSVEAFEDDPEDYYCFEVDSRSHLFLCTESYVVTHNTVSLLNMILSDIKNGVHMMAIDFKRDPAFANRLAYWAHTYGRPFYHFTSGKPEEYSISSNPAGQAQYDPLHSSSPAVRADMVLGMREYDSASAVYKNNMQQLLQVLFSAIDEADRSLAPNIDWDSGGINQIASCIEGGNLSDLARACEGKRIEKEITEILAQSHGKTQIRHALDELQGQMRTMTASQYGRWMRTDSSSRSIDLYGLTSQGAKPPVILFSIDSDAEASFAKYLGSLILADITNVSARRRNASMQNQVSVYIDEFQAVPPSSVTSLLEKSRASKLAMTLSLQSFEQIINASAHNGESQLKSILDTCGNFLIHAGAIEPSAKRLAEIQGTKPTTVYTSTRKDESFLGRFNWSNRRNQIVNQKTEDQYITPPSAFMDLTSPVASNGQTSTAMFLTKAIEDPKYAGEGSKARRIQVIPNWEVLSDDIKTAAVEDEAAEDDELIEAASQDEEEPDFDSPQPAVPKSPAPRKASRPARSENKTVIANPAKPDAEWVEEDPNTGSSDFEFVDPEKQDSKTGAAASAHSDELDDLPTLGLLNASDPFDTKNFKPRTLKDAPKSKRRPEPKTAPPKDEELDELPPLD